MPHHTILYHTTQESQPYNTMLNPTLPYLNLVYQTETNSREAYLGATQELHSGDFHSQSAGGRPRDFLQQKTCKRKQFNSLSKYQWSGKSCTKVTKRWVTEEPGSKNRANVNWTKWKWTIPTLTLTQPIDIQLLEYSKPSPLLLLILFRCVSISSTPSVSW